MNRLVVALACSFALSLPSASRAQEAAATREPAEPAVAIDQPVSVTADPATLDIKSSDALRVEGLDIQPGGLTIEYAAQRALDVSSSAGEKQAELDAANARITQTLVQFVPKLGLRASYMRLSDVENALGGALVGAGNPGPLSVNAAGQVVDAAGGPVAATAVNFPVVLDNFQLTASLTIPLSDYILRLSDANAGAEASREAARLALSAAESKVRTDARVLYYNYLRAHAQVHLATKSVERTRARLEDAHAAESVGRLAKADVMRIESLVAQAELGLTQAEALRRLIGAQLAIIMRDKDGGQYPIGSDLPDVAPSGPVAPERGREMINEALANRLELKAIDRSIEALSRGRDAVDAGNYPRLDAVGEVTYANPNQRIFPQREEWNATWALGLVASFSIDAPFMSGAQADELRANTEGLRATRSGVEAAVVNEVVTAQLDVVKASAALAAGETQVRAAEESYRVATDLFRVGRGTTSDLVDAESELIAAKAAIIHARVDLAVAALRLDYALGREAKGPQAYARKR